ncbi:hypothetical protein [Marinicellulosiphila megalodicopiae]|uniref:hypothetical protein n=1 Tax=Marinicellulosiphila megalodicopiae TaxID=2724896 RepID=UPI003BB2101B
MDRTIKVLFLISDMIVRISMALNTLIVVGVMLLILNIFGVSFLFADFFASLELHWLKELASVVVFFLMLSIVYMALNILLVYLGFLVLKRKLAGLLGFSILSCLNILIFAEYLYLSLAIFSLVILPWILSALTFQTNEKDLSH